MITRISKGVTSLLQGSGSFRDESALVADDGVQDLQGGLKICVFCAPMSESHVGSGIEAHTFANRQAGKLGMCQGRLAIVSGPQPLANSVITGLGRVRSADKRRGEILGGESGIMQSAR